MVATVRAIYWPTGGRVSVCFRNIWLLPETVGYSDFSELSRSILGVSPEEVGIRVLSPKAASFSRAVAMSPRRCDCESLIGSSNGGAAGELSYSQIHTWLEGFVERFGRKVRIGLIRLWIPQNGVEPESVVSVRLADINEAFLRGVAEKQLIRIRFGQW